MGLIRRDRLEDKGTLLIERGPMALTKRAAPVPVAVLPLARAPVVDNVVERAKAEAERIMAEAREEGRREGRDEAAARIEEALATLNEAVKERKKIVKDAESEILRLALKVAEQIIRSEVSMHRDVSLNIVAEAIGRISDREQIIVHASHEDAEYLKRFKDRLSGLLDGVKSFSIIEDSNIEAGGCVIETNLGFIDARIATKVKSIEEALQRVKSEDAD